jgi:recombination endonuclease VII
METDTRLCPRCGEVKLLTEFTRDRSKKSGYHGLCKRCNYLRLKDKLGSEHYRRYRKEWELQHRYGMNSVEYAQKIADQDGQCLICRLQSERLVVDHDHKTGQVRGLLCVSCNGLLGLANDSEPVLMAAIEYLRAFRSKGAVQQAAECEEAT